MTTQRLNTFRVAALVGPAMPMFAMMMPLAIFLPSFFAQSLGISMATVGTIFLVGRMFDVLTDPIAGSVMDRLSNTISRKAWVMIGAAPIAIAVWQLFFPETGTSTVELTAWLILLYIGWTLMSVGLYSWAAETSHDYNERSRIMGAVQMANSIGSVLVLLTPAAIEMFGTEIFGTSTDIHTARVNAMGTLILALLPVTLLFCWFFAPPSIVESKPARESVLEALSHAFADKSLRLLLLADLAIGINIGISTSLSVFFAEIILGLEGHAGGLSLSNLLAGLVGIPIWLYLARRFQKHKALALTALMTMAAGVFQLWIPPHQLYWFLAGTVVFGLTVGAIQFLPRAMMADVLDRDRLASGEERAGLYFSFLTTTLKLGLAIGIAIAFYLADYFGFDPHTARQSIDSHHVIRYLTAGSSMILGGILFLTAWWFPLGRDEQQRLRQAIDALDA